ncbi:MAG: hypothetical protein WEC17_02510 [Candidatus Saccharimonadales bacterium]
MAKNRPRRGSPLHLAGAFELFGQSYQIIKRNSEVFIVLFSVGVLLAMWETLGRYVEDEPARDWKAFLINRGFGSNVDTGVFAAGGFMFFISILYALAYLLLTIAVLRASQGQKITLSGLWRELVDRWLWLKLIGAFILVALALIAGFIALIIPGVILIWRLFFVPFVLIDQKTTIEGAFRRSWRMTRGFAWPIYSVIFVAVLLSITNVLPIFGPLIAFVLGAIYTVAPALRYQELKKISA